MMQRGKKLTAEQNIGQIHALSRVNVSLPKQAHDLLCTASRLHQRDLSSPNRHTRILSLELDKDLGRSQLLILGSYYATMPSRAILRHASTVSYSCGHELGSGRKSTPIAVASADEHGPAPPAPTVADGDAT